MNLIGKCAVSMMGSFAIAAIRPDAITSLETFGFIILYFIAAGIFVIFGGE